MGCRIRLARALAVLFSLKPEHRKEPLAQIRAIKNRFACVEELLWLKVWRQQIATTRGGKLVPQMKANKVADIDRLFFSEGIPSGQ